MFSGYGELLERARQIVQERYPNASGYKIAAFANCVAYLTTGVSGGYGGPSVREHAVGWTYAGQHLSFEDAVRLLLDPEGLIFGPIQQIHRECWSNEYCFDDDPDDVRVLEAYAEENEMQTMYSFVVIPWSPFEDWRNEDARKWVDNFCAAFLLIKQKFSTAPQFLSELDSFNRLIEEEWEHLEAEESSGYRIDWITILEIAKETHYLAMKTIQHEDPERFFEAMPDFPIF